ncbi:uncharacterized protein [Watersipora subatra]|uniref:uncharacterized protein n=1 Tax=Watersipora subatra TaxID=2589382 RepID=UPI00355BA762
MYSRILQLTSCLLLLSLCTASKIEFHFESTSSDALLQDASLEVHAKSTFVLQANGYVSPDVDLILKFDDNDTNVLTYTLSNMTYSAGNDSTHWSLVTTGMEPGHAVIILSDLEENGEIITSNYSIKDAFIRFQVFHSAPLNVFSDVIGWIYFAAWSISFYPQVYLNWRRKSVVGLNFDYLSLNFAGFLCYTIYNIGLFWIPEIKKEFREAHPYDILPVEVNDVIFAIHALCVTIATIVQVFMYERGGQRVSHVTKAILSLCALAALIFIIVAVVPTVTGFNWLSLVYALSYVKLGITVIKYIPQAWMNFKRKSTVGWSIGNVLLDFTGGSCSILQMFVLAYNFNDWASIFLNPVKFWLGALSIIFDIIFMVQHYCLYKQSRSSYQDLNGSTESADE